MYEMQSKDHSERYQCGGVYMIQLYECLNCEITEEYTFVSYKDRPDSIPCTVCGGRTQRVLGESTFVLAGECWYRDGYSRGSDYDDK